jgi:hypothetical protein
VGEVKVQFRRLILCLTFFSIPSIANGQSARTASRAEESEKPYREPSAQALELSRILALKQFFIVTRPTAEEMKQRITQQLLSTQLATKGPGCNPATAECRAIAEKIASEHAVADARAVNDAIDRSYADLIDEKMTPDQIRRTLDFIRTDAGHAFAAIVRGPDPREDKNILLRIASSFQVSAPFEEFYEKAKHLPRYLRPVPPPPGWPRPPIRNP